MTFQEYTTARSCLEAEMLEVEDLRTKAWRDRWKELRKLDRIFINQLAKQCDMSIEEFANIVDNVRRVPTA